MYICCAVLTDNYFVYFLAVWFLELIYCIAFADWLHHQ